MAAKVLNAANVVAVDTFNAIMHIAVVKTITLTDEAYERLASWKESPKESFSRVVLKVVRKRGTLGDLGAEIDRLPPLTDAALAVMEQAVSWANDWRNQSDPWTSSSTRRS
jgi:predicted CopG family antitoxin